MTDEEMADKYVIDTGNNDCTIEAFLAGLKAGRPKWHKVADGDLPKVGVQVLSEQGTLVVYKGDGFNWVEYSPNADSIKLRKWEEPIAWCEIPKYTEE
jgi:hypothetical protein